VTSTISILFSLFEAAASLWERHIEFANIAHHDLLQVTLLPQTIPTKATLQTDYNAHRPPRPVAGDRLHRPVGSAHHDLLQVNCGM